MIYWSRTLVGYNISSSDVDEVDSDDARLSNNLEENEVSQVEVSVCVRLFFYFYTLYTQFKCFLHRLLRLTVCSYCYYSYGGSIFINNAAWADKVATELKKRHYLCSKHKSNDIYSSVKGLEGLSNQHKDDMNVHWSTMYFYLVQSLNLMQRSMRRCRAEVWP